MPKAIPILILTTLLGLVSAMWAWSEVSTARGERDTAIAAQGAAEARTKQIQSSLRRVSSDYATSEQRLRVVLSTTPDRNTPRPVYDELCRRGNCAKLDSMPTPAD